MKHLAREHDKRLARTIALGARTSTSDLTANLPAGLSPDDPYRTGTVIDINKATPTADDLVASVFAAAEALDSKDVSKEGRVLVCTPESYYTLDPVIKRAVNFRLQPERNQWFLQGRSDRQACWLLYLQQQQHCSGFCHC